MARWTKTTIATENTTTTPHHSKSKRPSPFRITGIIVGSFIFSTLLFWPTINQKWSDLDDILSTNPPQLNQNQARSLDQSQRQNKQDQSPKELKKDSEQEGNQKTSLASRQSPQSKQLKQSQALIWWFENLPFPSLDTLDQCLSQWNQVGDLYQPTLKPYTYRRQNLIKFVDPQNQWTQVLYEKGDQLWLTTPPLLQGSNLNPKQQLFRHLRVASCVKNIGGLIHDPYMITSWTEQEWVGALTLDSMPLWAILILSQSEDSIEIKGLSRIGFSDFDLPFRFEFSALQSALLWALDSFSFPSKFEKQIEECLSVKEQHTLSIDLKSRVLCRLNHLNEREGSKSNIPISDVFPRLMDIQSTLNKQKRSKAKAKVSSKKTKVRSKSRKKSRRRARRRSKKQSSPSHKTKSKKSKRAPSSPAPIQFEYK